MAFIVQAFTEDDIVAAASIIVTDRKDALAVAVRWTDEGCRGVKIAADGRTYTAAEFALTVGTPNTPPTQA